MSIVIAVTASLLALLFFALFHLNSRLNRNLSVYVLYLLISEEFRNNHAEKLRKFIRSLKGPVPMNDYLACTHAVQKMAANIGQPASLVGIIDGIQQTKEEEQGNGRP
jgi:hypothetical protein